MLWDHNRRPVDFHTFSQPHLPVSCFLWKMWEKVCRRQSNPYGSQDWMDGRLPTLSLPPRQCGLRFMAFKKCGIGHESWDLICCNGASYDFPCAIQIKSSFLHSTHILQHKECGEGSVKELRLREHMAWSLAMCLNT